MALRPLPTTNRLVVTALILNVLALGNLAPWPQPSLQPRPGKLASGKLPGDFFLERWAAAVHDTMPEGKEH